MRSEFSHIINRLEMRGVKLAFSNKFLDEEIEPSVNKELKYLSRNIQDFYKITDGFDSYDPKSQLKLWNSKDIRSANMEECENFGEKLVVIGDFLMESDLVVTMAGGDDSPIKLLGKKKDIATNFKTFLEGLVRGDYDFLR